MTMASRIRLVCWINAAFLLPRLASCLQTAAQQPQPQQQQRRRRQQEAEERAVVITQQINTFEVLERIPHDSNAFTQGLTFDPTSDGRIVYESTGLYGQSDIRHVDLQDNGKVVKLQETPNEIFGEGLAYYPNDKLIHITWQKRRGFIFNAKTLETISEFQYTTSNNEGWGITYVPTTNQFIVTDGSHYLHFWNADTLEEVSPRIPVTMQLKVGEIPSPVIRLNEIEWDPRTSTLLANVWLTDYIVRIDPTTGQVLTRYDMKNLFPIRIPPADVLNGIAIYNNPSCTTDQRLWITGKKWPYMYRIRLGDDDGTSTTDTGCGGDSSPDGASNSSGSSGSPTGNGDIDGCFSATSTVEILGRGIVSMKDLSVGDKIKTKTSTTDNREEVLDDDYEIVYAFGHYAPDTNAEFLQFSFSTTTDDGDNGKEAETTESILEVTKEHLVYLHDKSNPVRADSIRVGDILQGGSSPSSSTTTTTTTTTTNSTINDSTTSSSAMVVVQSIQIVQRSGLYAPLTPSGTILVNGIQASTYISLQARAPEYVELNHNNNNNNRITNQEGEGRGGGGRQGGTGTTSSSINNSISSKWKLMTHQDLAHWFLIPFRWVCQQQQQQQQTHFEQIQNSICHSYNDQGIPHYIAGGINLARWIVQEKEEKSSAVVASMVLMTFIGLIYHLLCSRPPLQFRIQKTKAQQL